MYPSQQYNHKYISTSQLYIKRTLDLVLSFIGIGITLPVLIILWGGLSISTKSNGILVQERIGRYGDSFKLLKFKTMRDSDELYNHITTSKDPRITKFGRFLRKNKLDELPQLWNVLIGDMSFVGPRPDVPGYADKLDNEDRIILSVKPGITGPASLVFKNEEEILAKQEDPKTYNDRVIWNEKVKINKAYIKNYSLKNDIKIILKTVFG